MIGCLHQDVDEFIHNLELGKGFQHVVDSNIYLEVSILNLLGRVLLVPAKNGGWYISDILKSYQHD